MVVGALAEAAVIAGGAGEIEPDYGARLAVGAYLDRVGGAEDGDAGPAQRGGDVRGAGVVGDHERCAADERDGIGEPGLAGEIG